MTKSVPGTFVCPPESEKQSVIFKTTGVELFHLVSTTVFTQLANRGDYTKEVAKEVLQHGFDNLGDDSVAMSHPEFWQRGNEASGLNSAAVRKLATALNHAINVRDDVANIRI